MIFTQQNRRLQNAATEWIRSIEPDVFGTLKFTDGDRVGKEPGQKLLLRFWNEVDRFYFTSNAVRKGNRTLRVVTSQTGESRSNHHFHFFAKSPDDLQDFFCMLRLIWTNLTSETDGKRSFIDEIKSVHGASVYRMHEFERFQMDTLEVFATNTTPPRQAIKPQRSIDRLRQRLKALN